MKKNKSAIKYKKQERSPEKDSLIKTEMPVFKGTIFIPATDLKLTQRQREVLTLAANGNTNEEIAKVLVISRETVNTHIDNARLRLCAKNITHAVAISIIKKEIGGKDEK